MKSEHKPGGALKRLAAAREASRNSAYATVPETISEHELILANVHDAEEFNSASGQQRLSLMRRSQSEAQRLIEQFSSPELFRELSTQQKVTQLEVWRAAAADTD